MGIFSRIFGGKNDKSDEQFVIKYSKTGEKTYHSQRAEIHFCDGDVEELKFDKEHKNEDYIVLEECVGASKGYNNRAVFDYEHLITLKKDSFVKIRTLETIEEKKSYGFEIEEIVEKEELDERLRELREKDDVKIIDVYEEDYDEVTTITEKKPSW